MLLADWSKEGQGSLAAPNSGAAWRESHRKQVLSHRVQCEPHSWEWFHVRVRE